MLMCGRASQAEIKAYKDLVFKWLHPESFVPRRNLRPTEPAWIVARRPDGEIRTIEAKWWCQRDGAQEFETKYAAFNARAETLKDRPHWSGLLSKGKRCIFPIDSFYEWPVKGKGQPPVEIFVKGKDPFALAGLWSTWFDRGERKYSFAVFTCEPNEFMKPIHPKAMPVILNGVDEQKLWLMEGDTDLLRPYDGEMELENLPDTLEHLYPEENQNTKRRMRS